MKRITGLVLTLVLLIAGCQDAGNSPVTPLDISSSPTKTVSDSQNIVSWGVWEVTIDPLNGTYEIVPLRTGDFIANVTMFLQPPAGSLQNLILSNMDVDMSDPNFTIIDVDVGLNHPFPGFDRYTGFDVRGIFMCDEEYSSKADADITFSTAPEHGLQNSDGFTRWMNAEEFPFSGILGFTEGAAGSPGFLPSSTINGYKYFTDDLEEFDDVAEFFGLTENLEKRGYFRPGSVNYRHYTIAFPVNVLTFQYAVIASYEESDPVPPENIPDDFPLSANCDEAFHIAITDNGSTAYYVDADDNGGNLNLLMEIFDWGVLGGGTIDDQIGSITLDSPSNGLITTPVTFYPEALVSSAGTAVSSVYEIEITDVHPTAVANQMVLVTVTSAVQTTYDYGLGAPVPDAALAAYKIFNAPILNQSQGDPPTAVATECDCLWIAPGESVTFDGNQSWSPNGAITDWDWDFDGNGSFGDSFTGTEDHPTCTYNSAGTFDVNLRVTDVLGFTDTLAVSEQLTVHVGSWSPPTADSFITPTIGFIDFEGEFEGSGSSGSIDLYEWDFEGDCIWDYQHATIGDTTHAFTVADIYNSMLRVTGTGCDSIETEVRMIDPVGILDNGNFWDGEWGDWIPGYGGQATKIVETVTDPTFRHKVRLYRCCTSDGGTCYIRQFPDFDVSGYDELYFNIFFNLDYDELYGDGWMGGEMAIAVRIIYDTGTSSAPYWEQAWFGWDTVNDGTWQWDTTWLPWYVDYHFQEVAPADTWHEKKTIDLMTLDPQPVEIKEILIGSFGWDFITFVGPVWFSEE